jgi:hypothetical protein
MYSDEHPAPPPLRTRRGPGDRLREALIGLAGGMASVVHHGERSWASVTFAGARHRLDLVFEGVCAVDAGELFIAALPDHEFAIPGQLVADATVIAVDHRLLPEPRMAVTCEILLLKDA